MSLYGFSLYDKEKLVHEFDGNVSYEYPSLLEKLREYITLDKFNEHLPSIRVSMDQATRATGIYMTNQDRDFHLLGFLHRTGESREAYKNNLRNLITWLLEDCSLNMFLTESVLGFDRDGTGQTRKILRDLAKNIKGWSRSSFTADGSIEDIFGEIPAPMWKKHVIDNSKGPNRFNNKAAIAQDLIDKYPFMEDMFWRYKSSSGYDAFDALGIYEGYMKEFKPDDLVQKLGGTKMYSGHIVTVVKELDPSTFNEELMVGMERLIQEYTPKIAELDAGDSWYGNVRKAANRNVMTVVDLSGSPHELNLRVLFGLPVDTGKALIAFIIKKSKVRDSDLELWKRFFNVEVITW